MKNLKYTLKAWVEGQRALGRSHFSKAEAEKAYAGGAALAKALDRLLTSKIIAKPKAGFYIILDPPYRAAGSLPPEWFVDPLMKHLGLPYYVGGLSAAAHYGATHQALQELQVVVPGDRKGLRPIRCGRARIRFFLKSPFEHAVTQQAKSQAGYYKIASPETAAWDLVYFHVTLGGLNQAALFLKDMALSLDPGRLKVIAGSHNDSRTSRRLGWLLEKCGFPKLAAVLKAKNFLRESRCLAEQGTSGLGSQPYNETWNIIENASLDLKP